MVKPLLLSGVGHRHSTETTSHCNMVAHEQALLALDRDDKPRPTPESSRGSTTEAAEQRVERPSVSSDLGPDCEEILAGRPFY